ncbi:MAG: MBL fold metallo-hydrolase [Candidatus Acidiferrales bacterium]
MRALPILLLVLSIAGKPARADGIFSPERQLTELAEGIYEIRHQDPYPGWVNGNTTVIIGEREVFVVDSCSMSADAREDIEQIRKWTNKPVRYLLNTHWHQDHNAGNKDYVDAFPAVAIIARRETREMIEASRMTVPLDIARDATAAQKQLQQSLETGKGADGKPLTDAQKEEFKAKLTRVQRLFEEAKIYAAQLPTVEFDREMKIDLGNREVQVKYLGRGNTAGDALVYLPKEKIVVTGDLLVHPVEYAFDGYPADWIETLQQIRKLDTEIIVPGHGEILRDKVYLDQMIEVMKYIVAQVHEQFRHNSDASLEDVKKAIDLKPYRQRILGDDKQAGAFFDYSMGTKFVELAYYEAKQR